ncbi:MAG: McrC family protein, partial [Ignavibacteria bacterium]|nr:McrC family protein [Ignavibacteria bacterium]
MSNVRADIWINYNNNNFLLDTKWKNLNGYNPSPEDLKKMFVYHEYYSAKRVALVYPGIEKDSNKGQFYYTKAHEEMDRECHVLFIDVIDVMDKIKDWQGNIRKRIKEWCKNDF